MSKLSLLRPLAVAALFAVSGASQAAITVYTSQASFLAAVSAPGTDTFNDMPQTAVPTPISRTAGAYSYQASADYSDGSGPDSFYNAGVPGDTWLSVNTADDVVTFYNFSAGVKGVGGLVFGSDIAGAFTGGVSIQLTANDGGAPVLQTITNSTLSSFVGFVTTGSFSSIKMIALQGASPVWPTANNLMLAAAVPEPQTYALMFAGLGLVGFMARRRRG